MAALDAVLAWRDLPRQQLRETTDPLFHKDVSYFVFKLPFLSFLVGWTQVALIVLALAVRGGVLLERRASFLRTVAARRPAGDVALLSHLRRSRSVRAAGYFYVDRFALDTTNNGLFQGPGYTAVHVRLPALNLLTIVALAAFAHVRLQRLFTQLDAARRGGGPLGLRRHRHRRHFPWAVQSLQVNPAQSTVELPLLASNIAAHAGRLWPRQHHTQPSSRVRPRRHDRDGPRPMPPSLEDVDLWDPSISTQTYQVIQHYKGFYTINGVALDRYKSPPESTMLRS